MPKNVLLLDRASSISWLKLHRNALLLATLVAGLTFALLLNLTHLLKTPTLTNYQQGQNLYNDGHYSASLPLLKQAVAANDTDQLAARLTLADSYLALAQPLEAEAQLRLVLYYQPQNTKALYLSGQAFLQENRPYDAENAWYKAIGLNQTDLASSQARLALGEHYFRTGRYEDAAGLIYKALVQGRNELRPDDLQRAYYLYALGLAHDGRYNEAADELERVISLSTGRRAGQENGRVQNNLAELTTRANLMLPSLLQARDETIEAARRAKLGYAYLLANEYILAEQQFQRVLQLVPAWADMRAYLGLVYWQTGRDTQAVATFNQAIQTDATSKLARQLLAEYDLAQVQSYQPARGNPTLLQAQSSQARTLLTQLNNQYPQDALTELDLAQLDVAERSYTDAIAHYQRAISLTGGQPIHGLNPGVQLIQLYTDQGIDPCGRGLKTAAQTLQNTPTDPTAWYEAGLNYFVCRQPQLAIEDLQKSLQLRPNSPQALYRLGLIYQTQGDQKQADSLFEQVQDLDPNSHWPH